MHTVANVVAVTLFRNAKLSACMGGLATKTIERSSPNIDVEIRKTNVRLKVLLLALEVLVT